MSKKSRSEACMPGQIRVSLGTAIVFGLIEGKLDVQPTTAYLMTYKMGKCMANCGFCPQAKGSKSSTELLSRINWPTFPTAPVILTLLESVKQKKIKRVCIQALNYPDVFAHLEALVKEIKKGSAVPVSVSCQPHNTKDIERLAEAGVDRLGIALDAATEALFEKIKGAQAGNAYSWEMQLHLLSQALVVFGEGNVSTHVIVGLGETEQEVINLIQRCVDLGVLPALFAFTPIRGTALQARIPPPVESYRRVQLARHLIVNRQARCSDMLFDAEGKLTSFGLTKEFLEPIIISGLPFQTSGCPDCNRPFYNERPSGPFYNYPKTPSMKDIEEIKRQLNCG
ncbi:MAG: radical SAM protein [Candidatus Bathyarchaeota archaeon]|nr:radical SAM protein [Candidatus Bathyarchaeota archaeon]